VIDNSIEFGKEEEWAEELASDDNQEYFEHFSIVVDKGQGPLRIDKFLTIKLDHASRTKIQAASEANCILVNGKPVKSNYKVKGQDHVAIVLPHPPRILEIIPENIPLNIVYEDDHLIVVNKPAGLVVHPGYGNYTGTLVNALAYHVQDSELFKKENIRPGLVHRIDKNTSGLLLVAKTEFAMNHLARQFFEHTTERQYVALVWGTFEQKEGTITGYLNRDLRDRKKMHVFKNEDEGKWSVTHYKVIEEIGYVSVVECRLETGRTHQIRVHFQSIQHPLFNDDNYGGDRILKGTTFSKYKQFVENMFELLPRQALHAKTLGFTHPVTNERMRFDSPLAEDIQIVIERWRKYIGSRKD
jgi:23S rRNA pseudouridine1911/1915/1917 synthase